MSIAKQEPQTIPSLDAEKAFDRVDCLYLDNTPDKMGFQHEFLIWIKMLYTGPTSKV